MSDQAPLTRALETARGLKPGTWESVETLSILAIEAGGSPEGSQLLEAAQTAARRLKSGTWQSARALAWLHRAERESARATS